jgi:hypothetical protein
MYEFRLANVKSAIVVLAMRDLRCITFVCPICTRFLFFLAALRPF